MMPCRTLVAGILLAGIWLIILPILAIISVEAGYPVVALYVALVALIMGWFHVRR